MKRNIYIMYAIALLQGMVFYGPIATLYRQNQGVSIFQITVIESISLVLCILLEIPWGVVADQIGYKKTLVICCWLYFISKIIFWQAAGFFWFLAERILLSFVLAGLSGVDTSILYLSAKDTDSQKVFGIYNSMQMAGLLAASCVFSLYIKEDYRLAGLLTVASYGAAAILSLGLVEICERNPEYQPNHVKDFRAAFKETLGNGRLVMFLAAVAFLSEIHQTITVFLNQLQYEKSGLGSSAIGFIYIAATIIGMAGRYSPGVTQKIGTKFSFVLFCGLVTVSCTVLAFTEYAIPSVGSILVLRMSDSLFQPFQMELQNRQIHSNNRATILSIHAMVVDSMAVATNLAFGALSQMNLKLAFGFGGVLAAASLVLFLAWYTGSDGLPSA